MRTRQDTTQSLIQFVFVDASDLEGQADALEAMYQKRLDGMIVRNVFPRDVVEGVVERMETLDLPRRIFPKFADHAAPPFTIGWPIVRAGADLDGYYADAALQRERIRQLFPGDHAFEPRVEAIFSQLAGGLPAEIAPGPDGTTAPPATIRVLPEGHEIGVHVGNEFIRMPQARHIRQYLDMSDQISYFVPLSVPDGGGELVVYGLEWADVAPFMPKSDDPDANNVWLEGSDVAMAFDNMDSTPFAPGAGDMLIFDGGRYFHRVSKIVGARPRRTIGGFLGFSKDHDRVLYWS